MTSNRQLALAAKARGEKFFHGSVCSKDGTTLRHVSSGGNCVNCQRRFNREKSRQIRQTLEGREYYKAAGRRYRATEKGKAKTREHNAKPESRERQRKASLVYHSRPENRARRLQRLRERYAQDREYRARIKAQSRELRRLRAALSQIDQDVLDIIYSLANEQEDVDHFYPRARGGEHHPRNLWIMPRSANRSKGDSLPSPDHYAGFELFQATVVEVLYADS